MTDAAGRDVRRALGLGFLNNILLRFGNLLLGVVLARLLAPDQFGVFAVALTIQAVLANLTDLGITAYLVQREDVERRAPTGLTLGIGVGFLLAGLMWAAAQPLADLLRTPDATPVIQVLATTLVLTGAGSVPAALVQRRFQQGRQLAADGASFVVGAGVAIALIVAGLGAMSLAWSRVVGQLVAVVLLFVLSGYRGGLALDREVASDAVRFGLPLVGANGLSWLLLNLDYLLVGRILGSTALGFYVLAFNISSWPTSAISQGLRAVALPAFSRAQDAPDAERTRLLSTSVALTLAASAPIGAVLAVLAVPVVVTVYGARWEPSAAPLATLAALGVIRPLFDLLATFLTARGATRAVLVVQAAWTAALFPALLLGIEAGGTAGAGVAHVAVGLLVVLPAYVWAVRRQGVRPAALLRGCGVPLGAALVAGAVAAAATAVLPGVLLPLLVGGAAAVLVHAALVHRWARRAIAALRSPATPAEPPVAAPIPGS